jgi:DNA-directed RNA polymerase specialized sigma24 family protein
MDVAEGSGDFAEWYAAEHQRLITSLTLVTGNLDAARDATDEAFARAYGAWSRVSLMANRRGWTYHVALNVLRRRGRRARLEQALLARQPRPTAVPPPAGEAWEAVRRLPPRQRTAVVLRFVADLTEEQVGVVMGVSRSTISSSLADARRTLAQWLADPGDPSVEVGCA